MNEKQIELILNALLKDSGREWIECRSCEGTGRKRFGDSPIFSDEPCATCDGAGGDLGERGSRGG